MEWEKVSGYTLHEREEGEGKGREANGEEGKGRKGKGELFLEKSEMNRVQRKGEVHGEGDEQE